MPAQNPRDRDPHDPEFDPSIETEFEALQREATVVVQHLLTFVIGVLVGLVVL